MELAFTFTGAAHQNCFHPLTLGKGPVGDLCRRTSSFLARAPPAPPGPTSLGKPAGGHVPAPLWLPESPRGQMRPQRAAPLRAVLEQLDPSQPLTLHDMGQGKPLCNLNTFPKSLCRQVKPITTQNILGRPEKMITNLLRLIFSISEGCCHTPAQVLVVLRFQS